MSKFLSTILLVVGDKEASAVVSLLSGQSAWGNINDTYLHLILKRHNPPRMTVFWPISLCNVLYKLCSKVQANRLKLVLSYVISPFQSAFLANWLILYNIFMAYESLYTISTELRGKGIYIALKLDISKVYARI